MIEKYLSSQGVFNIAGISESKKVAIIKKDSNNRLYRGLRCFKDDLVLEIKSIVDEEYDSLDIYLYFLDPLKKA